MDQLQEDMGDGKTVLIHACDYGKAEIATLLCASGANVNHADQWGWTALHYAAYYGYPEIVGELLHHGAEVNMKTSKGYTPLTVVQRAPNEPKRKTGRVAVCRLLKAGQ